MRVLNLAQPLAYTVLVTGAGQRRVLVSMLNFVGRSTLLATAIALTCGAAHGAVINYVAALDGLTESPPSASPGTGTALVDIDTVALTMRVRATFSGLLGTTTAAHIHSATTMPFMGTAGVATQTPLFTGFPLGVTSGSYDMTFDMTLAGSFNPAFVTANGGTVATARTALWDSFGAGTAYFNIHTSVFGGGEIRGFLRPEGTVIPLPTPALMGLAGFGFVAGVRRRRSI